MIEQAKDTSKGSIQALYQVAEAAGYGDGRIGAEHNAGWVDIQFTGRNTRPSYDMNFIQTFSPEFVQELLIELNTARAEIKALREEVNEFKNTADAAN